MNNVDVRKYIINNFKDDSTEELKQAILDAITSKTEETLIGLGVLMEVLWNNSDDEFKNKIINNIKNGLV
ncbi:MAG: small acid-soluble spore protein SspI [bacterium]|nr:small acid-soluble spore protein SspI [bacterium]